MKQNKIAVIGMGYVGLSNAILLAQQNSVYAVDIDAKKIQQLLQKVSPIQDDLIQEYLLTKDLSLYPTNELTYAVSNSEFIILAVPTNYDETLHGFDTATLDNLIIQISNLNPDALIIIKSTVPIGYVEGIKKRTNNSHIIFSPEFLREGTALYDNLYPSRIVIGCDASEKEAASTFVDLLKKASLSTDTPIFYMGTKEAESVKLFSNTYLAMRVAYFNEIDTFTEQNNLNMCDILPAVGADPRIGKFYNNPSFGYGGYCLPKDTKQLNTLFTHSSNKLISAITQSNEERTKYLARQILTKYNLNANSTKTLGIYRLTMKAGCDNFRNASTITLINELKKQSIPMIIYEPLLSETSFDSIQVINNLSEFKNTSDIILANRYDSNLDDVLDKVYTRDVTQMH